MSRLGLSLVVFGALAAAGVGLLCKPGAEDVAPAGRPGAAHRAAEAVEPPSLDEGPAPSPAPVAADPPERRVASADESAASVAAPPGGFPRRFDGLVVRDEDGRPIAGATVEVHGWDRRTWTDAEGWFTLTLPWHRDLLVSAPGRAPRIVEAGAKRAPIRPATEIRLAAGGTVRLTLDDRRPEIGERWLVASADLDPHDRPRKRNALPRATFRTRIDDAGRATLAGLPAGASLRIVVEEQDEVLATVEQELVLEPGADVGLVHTIGHRTRVTGRVVSERDDRPRTGEQVTLFTTPSRRAFEPNEDRYSTPTSPEFADRFGGSSVVSRTTTDANGRFRFLHVPPGRYSIGAGLFYPIPTRRLEVPGDATSIDVTVRSPIWFIEGLILAPDGRPVDDAHVSWTSVDSGDGAWSIANHDGTFRLGPLWAGRYRLRAWSPDHALAPVEVVVDAGASNVVLRPPPGATIRGRLLDDVSGAQVAGTVRVSVDGGATGHVTIDSNGNFLFEGLAAGTAHLAATADDGRAARSPALSLVPGQQCNVDLRVRPRHSAELLVETDVRWTRARVFAGAHLVAFEPLDPNAPTTITVPADEDLTVRVEDAGDERIQTVRVPPGERRTLEFRFTPADDR